MTNKIGIALILTGMMTLTACNTVHGAGKDMNSAGKAIQKVSGEDKK